MKYMGKITDPKDLITKEYADGGFVGKSGDETVAGQKTFTTRPQVTISFPEQYAPVEYIQSNGAQYIDLGFAPAVGDILEVVFKPMVIDSTYRAVFGNSASGTTGQFYLSEAENGRWWLNSNVEAVQAGIKNTYRAVIADSCTLYINGVYIASAAWSDRETATLKLFARASGSGKAYGQMYAVRYWRGGELTHVYAPVKNTATGKYGLYDTVTGSFKGNAASGNDFTAGAYVSLSSDVALEDDLAPVAKSGSYDDLTGKPTIPTQLSQLTGDTTHRTVTDAEKSTWNSKGTYSKPSSGIPKSDLASGVQTSLDKADSALQSLPEHTHPLAGGSTLTDGFTTTLSKAYTALSVNEMAGNSTYNNPSPISRDPVRPVSTYWNSSSGAKTQVGFRWASAVTPRALRFTFGSYAGSNALALYYVSGSGTLTKLEDVASSVAGDGTTRSYDVNAGGVSAATWVVEITSSGWVNIQYMDLFSQMVDGFMSAEQAARLAHAIMDNENGQIKGSNGDTPLTIASGGGDTYLGYKNASGSVLGYLGINASKRPVFYDTAQRELALLADVVAKSQGTAKAGQFLVVGSDGNVTTQTFSTLAGGSY